MARRLEAQGDFAGALAALERAAAADPRSAEIRAEIAVVPPAAQPAASEAEKAAKPALAIDENNVEAHRALGLIYAGYADAATARAPARADRRVRCRSAITHLERAVGGSAAGRSHPALHARTSLPAHRRRRQKAVAGAEPRASTQNPDSVQARLSLAQAYAAADDLTGAIDTLEEIVDDEPRVARRARRSTRSRPAC